MSLDATDPGLIFGGTWEQIKGRFLLAASDEYKAEDTGGEATHKLTVAEMPSHNHSLNNASELIGWSNSQQTNITNGHYGSIKNVSMNNTGGNQSHNNMPPYLAVYMWKRAA